MVSNQNNPLDGCDFISGTSPDENVELQTLADLVGFPVSLIKDELLLASESSDNQTISMNALRVAVSRYIDKTFSA